MSFSLKDIADLLRQHVPRWDARRALAAWSILVVALYMFAPTQRMCLPRDAAFGILWILYALPWVIVRCRAKRGHWVVVMALEADPKADEYMHKCMRGIRSRLSTLQTKQTISIRRVHHEEVRVRHDADRMIAKKKADLVIWGAFTDGKRSGEDISVIDTYYTYRITPGMQRNFEIYQDHLNLIVGARDWQVRHKESFADIMRLQGNFTESCVFIIAVQMLTTQAAAEDSIVLFRYLMELAQQKDDGECQARMRALLIEATLYQVMKAADAGHWENAKMHAENLQLMGVSSIGCDSILARAYYECGDEPKARQHVQRLVENAPNSPITLFDQAFFAIVDRDYALAKTYYDRVRRTREPVRSSNEVIDFFSKRIGRRCSEPAYLYARGVVQLWYANADAGLRDLKSFVDRVDGIHSYTEMRKRAVNLIDEAERTAANSKQRPTRKKRSGSRSR